MTTAPAPDYQEGDVVEVCRLRAVDGSATGGWHRATVAATYTHQVSVTLADGTRMAFQRRNVRRPQHEASK
jgi:hypothetical protein